MSRKARGDIPREDRVTAEPREHIRSWQSLFECTALCEELRAERNSGIPHAEKSVEVGKLGGSGGLRDVPGRSTPRPLLLHETAHWRESKQPLECMYLGIYKVRYGGTGVERDPLSSVIPMFI